MSRRFAATVAVGAVAGLACLATAGSHAARAAQATASGWWWEAQQPGLPAPLPAPPTVPDGGLFVAVDPVQGAEAVAAMRIVLPPGSAPAELVLKVAQQSGVASVRACPTTSAWMSDRAGRWDARPKYDCADRSVLGTIDAAGTAVTFAAGSLARDGVLDVALVPDPASTAFQLALQPPEGDVLSTSDAGGAATAPDEAAEPMPASAGGLEGSASPDTSVLPAGLADQGLTAAAPLTSTASAVPLAPAPSAAGPEPPTTAPAPAAGAPLALAAPLRAAARGADGASVLGGVIVILLAAVYLALANRPVPAPSSLLVTGIRMPRRDGPIVRGIGPFRRERPARRPLG